MNTLSQHLDALHIAQRSLRTMNAAARNELLSQVARGLEDQRSSILEANETDVRENPNLTAALKDRLTLSDDRLRQVVQQVRDLIALPDPLGESTAPKARPNGLQIAQHRIPLGVLAVIYEARPNVTVECATLSLKSGNAVVLRGGREARNTNQVLGQIIQRALLGTPAEGAVWVHSHSPREDVVGLLEATGKIDLLIPRGGATLMALVDAHARVPVVRHGQGICHVFIDEGADLSMATDIVINSKTQRPGVCNALETLLIHQAELNASGPLFSKLHELGVTLHACAETAELLKAHDIPFASAEPETWRTEFLALSLAIRTVPNFAEALDWIDDYGTRHTASIITNSKERAQRFQSEVDASCVLVNASTRFNDGGELGLGAELGISTSHLHAFGPMGLKELTTQKYVVTGTGQTRS